jgi:hypothetical protein
MLNQYFPHLRSARTVPNQTGRIESIWQYVQTRLWNLWNLPPLVSRWKSTSHLLWFCIFKFVWSLPVQGTKLILLKKCSVANA